MDRLVHIYSHPRSGTHYLAYLMAANFYRDINLETPPGAWGHWADRRRTGISLVGKLFGHHRVAAPAGPAIYLYRDGRAIALSMWRSDHFLHPDMKKLTFGEFLRTKLDWVQTPSDRCNKPMFTIVENWYEHVMGWEGLSERDDTMFIQYEELVLQPLATLVSISKYFGLKLQGSFTPVKGLVGLVPNDGKVDSWRQFFSEADLEYFFSVVPKDCKYIWRDRA